MKKPRLVQKLTLMNSIAALMEIAAKDPLELVGIKRPKLDKEQQKAYDNLKEQMGNERMMKREGRDRP